MTTGMQIALSGLVIGLPVFLLCVIVSIATKKPATTQHALLGIGALVLSAASGILFILALIW